MYHTNMYEGMLAETVTIQGFKGDLINAYFARPLGSGPFPGMVLIHHLPGWDEWYREATRKFAHHGYATVSPNLYYRDGHGTPEDVAAGRHAFLVACRVKGFDAAVDCWGGRVVMTKADLTPKQPVAPIDYTKDLSCPLLGLFGEEDQSPSPEQVAQHEQELKKHGKTYEFHMYPKAGHGFFYYDRPNYRQEQAVDGWKKMFAFLEKYLSTPTAR